LILLAAAMAARAVSATSEAVTPIAKVLQMLDEMKAKGIAEKQAEEVRFSAFQQWCQVTDESKTKAIEEGKMRIEGLEATIAQAVAAIEAMAKRIAELEEDVARWQQDQKSAADVREKELEDYRETHKEYADTVDAIERAIIILKGQKNTEQSLLQQQLVTPSVGREGAASVRKVLTDFLQTKSKEDPLLHEQAPEAYAYEAQSGGILEMLKKLRARFLQERTDLEKEEISARYNFEMLKQKLTDEIKLAEQEIGQKNKQTAKTQETKATAEGDKQEAEKILAEDSAYLTDLRGLCKSKSNDFELRQKLRAEEIEAIAKAIDIIADVSGAKTADASHSSAFLQVKSEAPRSSDLQRVVSLLRAKAQITGSKVLALAAQRANDDPFAKVKKMIQDLLYKLLEEQAAEADHNAWCTAELATNKQTRSIKAEAVDTLAAETDKINAEITKLGQDISDLSDEMTEIDASIAEATQDRLKEKEANEATIADAKKSAEAVASALAVLRDFYAKSAQATALMQQSPAEDAPETFDAPYQGMMGSSGGVIGMLEVIESDFSRLAATTDTEETVAVETFRKFNAEAQQDKAVKAAEMEHKANKKENKEVMLESTQKSLEQTQEELDAALDYYAKLKPDCVDTGLSYEARVKQREEELQSLKEAYKMLAGEEVPSLSDMKAEQIGTL